jgi:hypothetical protein
VAVAHDTETRFPTTDGTTTVNSVDTTTGDRSFTHSASVNAKGAVVAVFCTGTTAVVAGVTYGGVSMTLSADAQDTTEAGRVQVFTLTGSTFPPGPQSVVLQTATATQKWACCSTVTATGLTTVNDTTVVNTTTAANPTATMATTNAAMAYAGVHAGNAAPATTGIAGSTVQKSNDYGALCANAARWTNVTNSGSTGIGVTLASDDHCVAAVAISEVVGTLFPTTPILDTFTGANGTNPPNANWTNDVFAGGGGRGIQIQSNQAAGNALLGNSAYWNTQTFPASQEAYWTIGTKPGNGIYIGLFLRLQSPGTAGADGYSFYHREFTAATDALEMYRADNAVETLLGASITVELTAGEKLGVRAIGSTLEGFIVTAAGVATGHVERTDATYSGSGNIGVFLQNQTGRCDDFGGGAYTPPGVLMQPMIPA